MKIRLIRSATIRLAFAGRRYLIDPWLARRGHGPSYAGGRRSPLVDLPVPVSEVVRGIDATIVSHLHSDHFDEAARTALPAGTRVFCAASDAEAIRDHGFTNVQPIAETLRDHDVEITLVEGRHGPPEVLADMGHACGFVFRTAGEPVLYWAGDTILCEEVRATIARFRPDVIVAHACGATWKDAGPLVMDEAMVAEVLRLAPRAAVVATHLDAVDHATVTRERLRRYFTGHPRLLERLHIPADGETLEFGA